MIDRRTILASAAALTLLGPAPAFAFSLPEAKAQIERAVGEITAIINSGRSEAAMLRDFEGVFDRYADVERIGLLVLGADGRTATAQQKAAFSAAFRTYMSRKYGRRFREFIGGRVVVDNAVAVKSFYEVATTAHLQGVAPFRVDFIVADANGRFIDMRIEGISLVKSERAEIGAMLDKRRGNLDQLISDLRTLG